MDSTDTRDPPGQGGTGDARVIRRQREATEDVKLCAANILTTPRTLMELGNRLDPALPFPGDLCTYNQGYNRLRKLMISLIS
jgi:hypothetical protein